MSDKLTTDPEPYPHAVRWMQGEIGLVKFPVNVHAIRVEHSSVSGYTTVTAQQNDVALRFILTEADCQHLAALLTRRTGQTA